ncbi:MAG: DUF4160 domain-containing protein [Pyrinomonadaceae bacterium]|nr:DUF4160 domain-containing protein [Pyrinomonadaceae bacterium]
MADADGWQARFSCESLSEKAVISIPDGNVIEGSIRTAKLKLVQAWIEIHRDELMADWKLAVNGQPVFKIDPLR